MSLRSPDEVRLIIEQAVEVSPQLRTLAKAYIEDGGSGDAASTEAGFLAHIGATVTEQMLIHPSADVDAAIVAVARAISAKLALAQAVWALIGAGMLVPRSDQWFQPSMNVGWTTVVPGSGGTSSGWQLDQFAVAYPAKFGRLPGAVFGQHLSDADLYLDSIGVELHPLVDGAIRDGVACLRADLYLPALAMLAKAAEGLWTIAAAMLANSFPNEPAAFRLGKDIAGTRLHFAQLLSLTTDLYSRKDITQNVMSDSGVTITELRRVREWTEVVRDSRNLLHFPAETEQPNTYEKTAALFLGAPAAFRALHAIAEAGDHLLHTPDVNTEDSGA